MVDNINCSGLGLLCLQTAKEGGLSSWVSSFAAYNEMVLKYPDLAKVGGPASRESRRPCSVPNQQPRLLSIIHRFWHHSLPVMYVCVNIRPLATAVAASRSCQIQTGTWTGRGKCLWAWSLISEYLLSTSTRLVWRLVCLGLTRARLACFSLSRQRNQSKKIRTGLYR